MVGFIDFDIIGKYLFIKTFYSHELKYVDIAVIR